MFGINSGYDDLIYRGMGTEPTVLIDLNFCLEILCAADLVSQQKPYKEFLRGLDGHGNF